MRRAACHFQTDLQTKAQKVHELGRAINVDPCSFRNMTKYTASNFPDTSSTYVSVIQSVTCAGIVVHIQGESVNDVPEPLGEVGVGKALPE